MEIIVSMLASVAPGEELVEVMLLKPNNGTNEEDDFCDLQQFNCSILFCPDLKRANWGLLCYCAIFAALLSENNVALCPPLLVFFSHCLCMSLHNMCVLASTYNISSNTESPGSPEENEECPRLKRRAWTRLSSRCYEWSSLHVLLEVIQLPEMKAPGKQEKKLIIDQPYVPGSEARQQ